MEDLNLNNTNIEDSPSLKIPDKALDRPKILIVDDEEELLTSLCDVLSVSYSNFDILGTVSAEDAIGMLDDQNTSLVITDLKLPAMNGLQLTQNIKNLSPNTPSILMTAYGNDNISLQAKNNGCLAYIQKPFDIDVLIKHIDKALGVEKAPVQYLSKQMPISAPTSLEPIISSGGIFRATSSPSIINTGVFLNHQSCYSGLGRRNSFVPLTRAAKTPQQLVNIGVGNFKQKKLVEAKKCWLEALELDPNCTAAKNNLAILNTFLQMNDEIK